MGEIGDESANGIVVNERPKSNAEPHLDGEENKQVAGWDNRCGVEVGKRLVEDAVHYANERPHEEAGHHSFLMVRQVDECYCTPKKPNHGEHECGGVTLHRVFLVALA